MRRVIAVLALCAALVHSGAAYTVRPGDTLGAIARRVGATVAGLVAANGIRDPDHVVAGTRLRVPGSGAADDSGEAVHVVRAGEHLTAIAGRYGVSRRALAEANRLRDPDRVLVGQRLRIPRRGPGMQAPPVADSRDRIGALLESTARRHGWSPAFVKALAWQESGWNPRARSRVGAVGVMQVMPETGRFVSRTLAGRPLDLADTADNIEAGVAFLDYLYRLSGRDPERTLAGYYQGLASVRRHGLFDDTRRYVANVLALRARFR